MSGEGGREMERGREMKRKSDVRNWKGSEGRREKEGKEG